MKLVGVSLGTKNGSNDSMCKEALIAAQELGAEVSFIHLHDWDIQYCTGCVACSRGLVMGKGNICTRKDEFDEFRSILLDADGILIVDPIFEKGASALFHSLMDRFGPRMDRGMNIVGTKIAENGGAPVDPRLLKDKVISFIGIGGSDWATAIEYDHTMLALSPAWKIIDNEKFAWSKNIIMEEEKVERVREIGRNLYQAATDIEAAAWQGDAGVCPHCHCKNFYFGEGDSNNATCMTCGIEGKIEVENGKVRFVFADDQLGHAHDTLPGKFIHADDIKENEGKAIENRKSEKFKASAERIKGFHINEILPPSKRA